MSEALVGLNSRQRDIVLRGLRFVRRAIMLDVHDPTPTLDSQRDAELQEVAQLVSQLAGDAGEASDD